MRNPSVRETAGVLCLTATLLAFGNGLALAQFAPMPREAPVAQANRLTRAPVVDGDVLGDPAWEGAVPLTGFWQIQPNEGQPATQTTEVFVGFSDTSLHIGVVLYDDDPSGILVTDSRRDAELDDTDAFLFIVDGLLSRQNGFVFGTNPAGIQFDGQLEQEVAGRTGFGNDSGFNKNWDAPWNVQTQIGDFGWSAEFEIPLRSLRFGSAEEQSWGFNFQRNIRRNNEVAFWAPLGRDRNLMRVSEAGTIEGFVLPKPRNLQITPYVLGKARRGGTIDGTQTDEDVGFDVKYSVTPSLTLDLTYNTDFAQVEVDDQQINLDRFSLFFPEKRPFFLENSGLFTVGNPREVELFFSRRIGIGDDGEQIPIDGGLRLSGKIGPTTNVGLLFMQSEAVANVAPEDQFSVVRVNQELPNRSSIGVLFVDRDGDGSHILPEDEDENQTYAIDGRWGVGDNLQLQGWVAKTQTPGLTGKDDAFAVHADYESADWAYSVNYTEVGGDFNPEVGFLTRKDYRRSAVFGMYKYRPEDLYGLLEIRPHVAYREFRDFDGFRETGFTHIDVHWEFESSREIHTGVNLTTEGVTDPFEIIPGVVIPAGTYNHSEGQLVFMGNRAAPLNFGMRATVGGRFGGDRVSLSPTLRYRIGETFTSELSYNYNDFDLPVPGGDFTANLASLRLSYSFTPSILLQLLTQYNEVSDTLSTNLRFSWLRTANSGLFVVYNELDERGLGAPPKGREFIIKYSHIFDVFN